MSASQGPEANEGGERRAQARAVAEECLRRRAAGQSLTDDQILAAHPDIAAELAEELAKARLIGQARRAADEAPTMSGASGPPLTSAAGQAGRGTSAPGGTAGQAGRGTPPGAASDAEDEGLPPSSFKVPGYGIIREISRGGQAVVFEALQESTGRKVAIKVLREGPFLTARQRARFDREVQILAALKHPNIVSIIDRGATEHGAQYLVMDYIEGRTLDQYLADYRDKHGDAPPDPSQMLRLFLKIADAVNAAHLRGIVHRDLKPSNIRIDARGEPHILDFGLAAVSAVRSLTDESVPQPVTLTGQFLGSLPWASPEQAEGLPDKIDIRSDVYSLGVILYQMLTGGHFPYEVAGTMRDVLNNIITVAPTPPSQVIEAPLARKIQGRRRRFRRRKPVNEVIEAIVLKSLAKGPQERYQSAGDFARDIGNYLSGQPTIAAGMAALRRQRRSRLLRAAVVAGGIVAACGLTAAVMLTVIVPRYFAPAPPEAPPGGPSADDVARQARGAEEAARAAREAAVFGDKDVFTVPTERLGQLRYVGIVRKGPGILTIGQDGIVRLWDVLLEKERRRANLDLPRWWHPDRFCISPDGALGFCTEDLGRTPEPSGELLVNTAGHFWDLARGTEVKVVSFGGARTQSAPTLAFSPDGRLVVSVLMHPPSGCCLAILWNADTGEQMATFRSQGRVFAFSQDMRLLVLGDGTRDLQDRLRAIDLATRQEVRRFKGHKGSLGSAVVSPDGRFVLGGGAEADPVIIQWDAATGDIVRRFEGHTGDVTAVAMSADGRWVLSSSAADSDNTLRIWDAQTGREVRRWSNAGADEIHLPPDRAWAVTRRGVTLRLYRLPAELPKTATPLAPATPPTAPAPPSAAADTAVGPGQWIDLLARVDPQRDTVSGEWQRQGQTVSVSLPTSKWGCLVIPVAPGGDYELEACFVRLSGQDEVGVSLPVGDAAVNLCLSENGGVTGGLGLINGKKICDNETAVNPSRLENGREYVVHAKVLTDGPNATIEVALDGQPYTAWRGPRAALSREEEKRLPRHNCLGLRAVGSTVAFFSARLRMLSGAAMLLGSPPAAPEAGPER